MTDRIDPRATALAAAATVVRETDPKVEFDSKGRVLIIGSGEVAADAARQLSAALSCHLLTDGSTPVPRGVAEYRRHGSRVFIDGHLGAFTARFEFSLRNPDLGAVIDPARPFFDLVLDLGAEAAIAREWGPPGYYRPLGEAALASALAELPRMTGRLEKPRYFQLDATICAHGQPGIEGCRRCLDACPAGAIESVDSKIEVNANLCQGAGACATTCPTGALTYRYPPRADTLERLRVLLETYRESGGSERPVVVVLDERTGTDPLTLWPQRVLPLTVLEVGSLGMETWFSALALGAVAVRIVRAPGLAESIERVLDEQLGFARAILVGLGYSADVLSWMSLGEDPLEGEELLTGPQAVALDARSKRGVLYAALDQLRAHAPVDGEVVPVPSGSPFGLVHVDAAACTTCLACAFTCPTRALASGGDAIPRLLFTEAACVQCGLCEVACPEKAITREPRLLLGPERTQSRLLHEDEPFACISCGKHFASVGTVRAVVEKLADHPMFAESGIEVLKTCDECRLGMPF